MKAKKLAVEEKKPELEFAGCGCGHCDCGGIGPKK